MNKFFKDILSNPEPDNSFSMTKFAVLIALAMWVAQISTAIWIMISTKTIDHIVIGEVVSFVLVLLGYKNSFGFGSNGSGNIVTGDLTPKETEVITKIVQPSPKAEEVSKKQVL